MDSSDEVYIIIIPYLYLIMFNPEPDVTCFLFGSQKERPVGYIRCWRAKWRRDIDVSLLRILVFVSLMQYFKSCQNCYKISAQMSLSLTDLSKDFPLTSEFHSIDDEAFRLACAVGTC